MRWLKRITITLLVFVQVGGLTLFWMWRQASATPDWYTKARTAPALVGNVEQSLLPTQNWAAKAAAGNVDAKPPADKQHTVELTDAQINALITKWSDAAGVADCMNRQLSDFRVRLENGQITLAGRSAEYDRVLSVVLEPVKEGGRVKLNLAGIYAGDQRLPLVALSKQQSTLQGGVARRAAAARDQLSIDSHGVATAKTAELYYTTLLGDLFAGRQPGAYAFLNFNVQDTGDAVVTRVTDMTIDGGKIRLAIEMLSPTERTALVDHLKSYAAPDAQ